MVRTTIEKRQGEMGGTGGTDAGLVGFEAASVVTSA
jgi:hypothetical protein